jgi:hypothetical protein
MINMSSAFIVGLLVLSLAARPSDGQVDQISEVAVEHCRPVDRISTAVVTDFRVDRTPDVKIMDERIDRIPTVSDTDYQADKITAAEIADDLPDPWIPDLFYRALSDFSVKNVGSSACRTQSDMYDRHLRNHTSWAVRSEYRSRCSRIIYCIYKPTAYYNIIVPILLPINKCPNINKSQ